MADRFVFDHDSRPGFLQLNPLHFEFENFSLNVKPNLPYLTKELQTNNGDKWKIEVNFGSLSTNCSIIYCGPNINCNVMVDFSILSTSPFGVSRENTIQTLCKAKASIKKSLVRCKDGSDLSFLFMTLFVGHDNLILVAKIWIANEDSVNMTTTGNHNSLLTDMQTFYSNQSNLDVCFVVESLNKSSERILAHKLILVARSAVFKTMFSTEMNETSSNEIHITDFSADTVRLFVKFLYTDACDEVYLAQCGATEELFRMAHKYEVNGLASLCEAHLASSLDVNNAADRLVLAATYTLPYLKEKCVRFIGSNFKEVSSTADFHAKLDSVGVDIYREIVHAMN